MRRWMNFNYLFGIKKRLTKNGGIKRCLYHVSAKNQGWIQTKVTGIGIPFPKSKLNLIPKTHRNSFRKLMKDKVIKFSNTEYGDGVYSISMPVTPYTLEEDYNKLFDAYRVAPDNMTLLLSSSFTVEFTNSILLNTISGPTTKTFSDEVAHMLKFLEEMLQIDLHQPIEDYLGSDESNFRPSQDLLRNQKAVVKDLVGLYQAGFDGVWHEYDG